MGASGPTFDERAPALGALAYRVGFRILGDRQDAQDLTQEALARAYARWSRVGPYDEAWVTRVATNLALGVVRKRERAGRRRPDPVPLADEPGTVVVRRQELVAVLRALPKRQREVVALRYLADLPEAEVAAALGCSVGTVKQHASRGLAALRAALAIDAPDTATLTPEGTTP
jgi:RNA polymerase sigma-70 factor (sigma-E family)